ncbi:hypothetical protein UPYG_G00329120 [Umbra pygmaea]|uniref:L-seryl-tRNA(Sec) kinase n=1 Tax=Umbra pygmaea TaxID=75934 RepID=A0ABD0W2H4_UMBPY
MELTGDHVNERYTRTCLCVLCGLPAAGKSTFAQVFRSGTVEQGWRSTLISYDDLIPEDAFTVKQVEDEEYTAQSQTKWKLHRQAVLQCIELLLQSTGGILSIPGSHKINSEAWSRILHPAQGCRTSVGSPQNDLSPSPRVIVLDDNFYYSSMRYEVYKLARKYSLGFCQVYVHCPVESCIRRNQSRPQPLPSDVIVEMANRMEPPNPQRNLWERYSVTLNSTAHITKQDFHRMLELISTALENPMTPVQDDSEQKEADRQNCASSVVHQADHACRRLVSQAMKAAREKSLPPESMRSLAEELNESKTRFLQNLRKQVSQGLPLTTGEIDVERMVTRAVDVFNQEKLGITARYLS